MQQTVKQRPSATQPPDRQPDKKMLQQERQQDKIMPQLDKQQDRTMPRLEAPQQEQPPVVRPQAQLFSPTAVSSRTPCRRTSTCSRARSSPPWSRATV